MEVDLGINLTENAHYAAVIVFFLLICGAFFSSSETGLTAASRALMHHLEHKGSRRAKIANKLRDNQNRLIGGIMLGNNLVNILASSLTTSVLIHTFGDAGVAYATVVVTILVVVFGEVLPKTYAINNPERVALFASPLMNAVIIGLTPFLIAIEGIVNLVLRLFGADMSRGATLVSATEELRSSLDLKVKEGHLVKQERDMMGSILDLSDVTVADVMIHRKSMVVIDADRPPAEIVETVLGSRHTRLPLWRENPDNIVGVLHAKDLLRALAAVKFEIAKLDMKSVISDPWFVPDTTSIGEQLSAFRQRRAHFALVVDEYGTLMGLVTLEDILEEIVGDIRDEHDATQQGLREDGMGGYVVDGATTIRDLNRQFGWSLPDEEATTIAGLVIHEARMIPDPGQVFMFHGLRFEVLRRQRNQITQLRIARQTVAAPPATPDEPA